MMKSSGPFYFPNEHQLAAQEVVLVLAVAGGRSGAVDASAY